MNLHNLFLKFASELEDKNLNGYRVRVESIVFNKDKTKVLLEEHDNKPGVYFFPGGGVVEGESNGSAAIREVAEETGLKTSNPKDTKISLKMPWSEEEKKSLIKWRASKLFRLKKFTKGNITHFVAVTHNPSSEMDARYGDDGDKAKSKWFSVQEAIEYFKKEISKKNVYSKINLLRMIALKRAVKL